MDTVMLNTFVVAATTGSVSETARTLRYSESTVSYHIREVEKFCRGQLFERQIRGLSLTRRGMAVLEISHQLLRMASELESLPLQPASGPNGRPAAGAGSKVAT